jgi:hypothetical protein
MITYKVELYNYFDSKCRFPGNGYYVGTYVDGCRTGRQIDFKRDEIGARLVCAFLNNRQVG